MMEALTQGQATYMEHHAHKVKQPIATKDRLRRKLAVRRGEDYDPDGLALAEKVVDRPRDPRKLLQGHMALQHQMGGEAQGLHGREAERTRE